MKHLIVKILFAVCCFAAFCLIALPIIPTRPRSWPYPAVGAALAALSVLSFLPYAWDFSRTRTHWRYDAAAFFLILPPLTLGMALASEYSVQTAIRDFALLPYTPWTAERAALGLALEIIVLIVNVIFLLRLYRNRGKN